MADQNPTKAKGLNRGENFSMSLTPVELITPQFNEDRSYGDIDYNYLQPERTSQNANAAIVEGTLTGTVAYSTTSAKVTVDPVTGACVHGLFEATTTGPIVASHSKAGAKSLTTVIFSTTGSVPVNTLLNFKANTLGLYLQQQLEAMVVGLTPNIVSSQAYFLTNNSNVSAPVATRNPDRFTKNIDMSGISAMRTGQTIDGLPLYLVTDRHALFSVHTIVNVGDTIVFLGSDDTTFETVTVLGTAPTPGVSDLGIAYLSAAITGCKIFKVMPENWTADYAPALRYTENQATKIASFPLVAKLNHDSAGVLWKSWVALQNMRLDSVNGNYGIGGDGDDLQIASLVDWWQPTIDGDSGSPAFAIIGGEAILVSVVGAERTAASVDFATAAINTTMDTLAGAPAGTYQLQHVDLSGYGFETYSL